MTLPPPWHFLVCQGEVKEVYEKEFPVLETFLEMELLLRFSVG
jgi:hypothetical protein